MKVFKYNCVFCKGKIKGYAHNPYPLKSSGFSCYECHKKLVIPAKRDIYKDKNR